MPEPALHVVLVEPEIHWNTGNAGRTCLAAGARLHLVGPLGFSLDARQVRRAGLDYWPWVMPCLWAGWEELARDLPTLGEPILLAVDGRRELWDFDLTGATVFVLGRESVGLAPGIRAAWPDRLARLPQRSPHVRSLNLSTCVGIALYEALRQRRAAGPRATQGAGEQAGHGEADDQAGDDE